MVVYRMYRNGKPVAVTRLAVPPATGRHTRRANLDGVNTELMRSVCKRQFHLLPCPTYACWTPSELRDGGEIETYTTPEAGDVAVIVGHLAPAPQLGVPA